MRKMGIDFNKDDKFRTKDGRQMPVPEKLINV
jgi:hypothetical protein